MMYDTIEIKLTTSGEWEVIHRELPYDRKKGEQHLNGALGFFHYPRNLGKENAFRILRDRMIDERLKAIADLQIQIDKLRALLFGDDTCAT
jgi:hypothetical protein